MTSPLFLCVSDLRQRYLLVARIGTSDGASSLQTLCCAVDCVVGVGISCIFIHIHFGSIFSADVHYSHRNFFAAGGYGFVSFANEKTGMAVIAHQRKGHDSIDIKGRPVVLKV